MAEEKLWNGRGKEFKWGGGEKIRISQSVADLEKTLDYARKNGGWANSNLYRLRQPDAKGNTHSMSIDTWKPDDSYKKQDNSQSSHNEKKSNGYQPQDRPANKPAPDIPDNNSGDDDDQTIPF